MADKYLHIHIEQNAYDAIDRLIEWYDQDEMVVTVENFLGLRNNLQCIGFYSFATGKNESIRQLKQGGILTDTTVAFFRVRLKPISNTINKIIDNGKDPR